MNKLPRLCHIVRLITLHTWICCNLQVMTLLEQQALNTSPWRTLNICLNNALFVHLLWPVLQNHKNLASWILRCIACEENCNVLEVFNNQQNAQNVYTTTFKSCSLWMINCKLQFLPLATHESQLVATYSQLTSYISGASTQANIQFHIGNNKAFTIPSP